MGSLKRLLIPGLAQFGDIMKTVALSSMLGYYLSRTDLMLAPFNYIFTPAFHFITRNQYRYLLGPADPNTAISHKHGKRLRAAHSNLFMMGIFSMAFINLFVRLAVLRTPAVAPAFAFSFTGLRQWWNTKHELLVRWRETLSRILSFADHATVGFLMCHVWPSVC